MRFAGRAALVTGGSRGIGRAIALRLAREGADVAVNYFRNEDGAEETCAQVRALGRTAVALRGHVGDAETCERLVADAADALGGLDTLVSNAASGILRPAVEMEVKHWAWTMDVNARALLLLAKHATPHLQARGGGAMVALTSLGSTRVLENYSVVGASKAAIEALVRYLGVELAPDGIRVNAVSGGVVETDALRHFPNGQEMIDAARARTPAGRMLTPDDLAAAACFLLSDEAAMVCGQTLVVDGGYALPC